MKKLLFVYNPHSGKGALKSRVSDVVDIFVKAGYEVTIYPTQCYHDAYNKILNIEEKYDLIVCSGGDGTIDETVTAMMQREKRIPIGYIPTGTTNDFANSLHLSRNILQAADTAVNGEKFSCDVGCFNEDSFVYVAAFGLFTDVPYQTNQSVKNILGHLAYVLEGAKRIWNIPSYKIKVVHDGQEIEEEFMLGMITNSRSVGGFRKMIGDSVRFDDGVFEVTLIKKVTTLKALQEIASTLMNMRENSEYMYTFKTGHITFESDDAIPWTLDGEYGGDHKQVCIRNAQKALSIMVAPEYKPALMEFPETEEKLIEEKEQM